MFRLGRLQRGFLPGRVPPALTAFACTRQILSACCACVHLISVPTMFVLLWYARRRRLIAVVASSHAWPGTKPWCRRIPHHACACAQREYLREHPHALPAATAGTPDAAAAEPRGGPPAAPAAAGAGAGAPAAGAAAAQPAAGPHDHPVVVVV